VAGGVCTGVEGGGGEFEQLQSQSNVECGKHGAEGGDCCADGVAGVRCDFRAEFIELRDYMLAKIAEIPGVTCTKPEGAFYVYRISGRLWAGAGFARRRSWRRGCCTRHKW